MKGQQEPEKTSRVSGSQTLARGLSVLRHVADSPEGMGVQDVADRLGVHRTIAYRILATLADFHLVVKAGDGRYRAGAGTVALARSYAGGVQEAAMPLLRRAAEELGATVALLVAEGEEAVALAVAEPQTVNHHIAFRLGSRHSLSLGAAGLALRSLRAPVGSEADGVAEVRERGYAMTFGQVEPGAYGVAVPVHLPGDLPLCVNLITLREEVARDAVEGMQALAEEIRGSAA